MFKVKVYAHPHDAIRDTIYNFMITKCEDVHVEMWERLMRDVKDLKYKQPILIKGDDIMDTHYIKGGITDSYLCTYNIEEFEENIMKYPSGRIKLGNSNLTIEFEKDKIVSVSEYNNIKCRLDGQFRGLGYWLDGHYNWQIIKDEHDELVLVCTKN